MENKSFVDIIKEQSTAEDLQLPLFHPVALKLQQVLRRSDFTIESVINLIMRDQALASQILRIANSAFFSGLSKVATIHDAVIRLGAKQVANIAMMANLEENYTFAIPELRTFSQDLWKHAMGCALGSRWLAEKTGYKNLAQEAFLGGLLHDIGKLFILKVLEKILVTKKTDLKFSKALTLEIMESVHRESGYSLMQKWNLPETYCVIVRDHNQEQSNSGNVLLSIVRLVDNTCRKIGLGLHHDPTIVLVATFEAQVLGIKEIMLAELEIMLEDTMGIAPPSQ